MVPEMCASSGRTAPNAIQEAAEICGFLTACDHLLDAQGPKALYPQYQTVHGCRLLNMNFYEKALFVKPTWRPALCGVNANCLYPSRYASIRTSVSPLFCGSVHRMRSVVSASTRRCCNLRSGLPPGR